MRVLNVCAVLWLCLWSCNSAAQSVCQPGETVYFSCKLKGSSRIVSLCGSVPGELDTDSGKNARLQYRFGRPGKLELVYPQRKKGSLETFKGEYSHSNHASIYMLHFTNRHVTYTVNAWDTEEPFYGITVENDSSSSARRAAGPQPSKKELQLPCDAKPVDLLDFSSLVRMRNQP